MHIWQSCLLSINEGTIMKGARKKWHEYSVHLRSDKDLKARHVFSQPQVTKFWGWHPGKGDDSEMVSKCFNWHYQEKVWRLSLTTEKLHPYLVFRYQCTHDALRFVILNYIYDSWAINLGRWMFTGTVVSSHYLCLIPSVITHLQWGKSLQYQIPEVW